MYRSLFIVALFSASACAQTQPTTAPADRPATQPVDAGPAVKLPYTVQRIARPGPMTGVVVSIDLTDPRVHIVTSLTDPRDPDGDGPAVGRLQTVFSAAIGQDLEIAMNASFFAISGSKVTQGKKVGYYVGNGTWPVGWLRVDGVTITKPKEEGLRATMVVHNDGHVSMDMNALALPDDAKFAVSGNKVLAGGEVFPKVNDRVNPRSAVGLSADGKTLVLLVIDGRRPFVSMGVLLADEAALLKEFGASDGINLDGGGSAVLVIKDMVTGVHAILNKPSEFNGKIPAMDSVQRPVADLIGVQIDDERKDEK